jgi:penicillin-binding protein 1B
MKAIVSIEDQRFLDHSGIDPRGIARSIYVNVRAGGYVQGASTITQQMVRNIYLSRDKTLSRKIKEIIMALMIEYKYSKDTILEKYLNEVYFGQSGSLEIHGVAEAAKFYFGKQLAELSLAEQALLAGIVRGPFYYSPYRHLERAKQRQEIVLKKMLDTGAISQSEFKKAMSEPLRFVKASHIQDRAPYFTDMVKAQLLKDMPEQSLIGLGYKIFSTVDTYYQQLAEKAVARQIDELEARLDKSLAKKKGEAVERRILQGTFVALDPLNNELLAIVGGRSYEESNYNRALYMRRHVGSLMKPFVFLAGLIHGANPDGTPMNAVTKLQDSPFTYEYDKQSWSPKNYEGEYLGEVTFRFALAKSLNVPTARLAVQVGLDKVVQAAQAAGIETKLEPLPALSLGAVELTPMEIVQAYSTIANLGKKREIAPLLAVVDEQDKLVAKFVAREESALPVAETANLLELLRGVFEIGTAKISSQMGFQYPTAAGKTGTTNDYRDSWFVGFTPKIYLC